MRALDFPSIKPFASGFFTPVDIVEHEASAGMAAGFAYESDLRQKYEIPCGMGFNHDYAVAMRKRELIEDVAFKTLKAVSSQLHMKGVPTGSFLLGGQLPVNGFYHRRILNMPTWLDEPYEKRMVVGKTLVADAVKDAARDMVVAAGIGPEDFDKIKIVVGTDPSSARYFLEPHIGNPVLFGESPLNNIALEFATTLNLHTRNRFFVSLALKTPQHNHTPSGFGAILHQHDTVTNETMNGEEVLVYHCHYQHIALLPILADIRMDLGI